MTPTQVVTLGLLAVAWLAIAFPLALRTRSESLSGTITGFHHAMHVLDPDLKASTVSAATHSAVSRSDPSSHLRLLRRVLVAAVATTGVLVVAAVAWGTVFIPLAVVSLVGTTSYVSLLRRRKVEQDRARAVITSIRDSDDLPLRHDRRAPLPRAVGEQYARAAGPVSQRGGRVATQSHTSDVRVLSDGQRIEARHGFDLLD